MVNNMIVLSLINKLLFIYFITVIISLILFYHYFLNFKIMNDNNINHYRNNDLNDYLLYEDKSKNTKLPFFVRFRNNISFNFNLLKSKLNNALDYCIGRIKNTIRKYKYRKINEEDYNLNIFGEYEDDNYNMNSNYSNNTFNNFNNDFSEGYDSYDIEINKNNKPYFNYEINETNISNSNNMDIKNIPNLVRKSNMKNSLDIDLTSTINTDEIYKNNNLNFSVTRIDTDSSDELSLDDSLI